LLGRIIDDNMVGVLLQLLIISELTEGLDWIDWHKMMLFFY